MILITVCFSDCYHTYCSYGSGQLQDTACGILGVLLRPRPILFYVSWW